MAMTLGAPQTLNQLNTVAEFTSPVMGQKRSAVEGFAYMNTCLNGTRYQASLGEAQDRLNGAAPLMGRPFIWNTEQEFMMAKMSVDSPMYGNSTGAGTMVA
jgi:hypothetical protein